MTQNIYDTPEFFREYSRLERSQRGLDGAWEWPLLKSLLPELKGKRILDLGCTALAWLVRVGHGSRVQLTSSVSTLSQRMLDRARGSFSRPTTRSNTEKLILKKQSFLESKTSILSSARLPCITIKNSAANL